MPDPGSTNLPSTKEEEAWAHGVLHAASTTLSNTAGNNGGSGAGANNATGAVGAFELTPGDGGFQNTADEVPSLEEENRELRRLLRDVVHYDLIPAVGFGKADRQKGGSTGSGGENYMF